MIATIFGSNIGSPTLTSGSVANGVLGTDAGGTQTFFNGVPGPMIYSTQNQISAIAPFSLLAGGASVGGQTHVYIEVVNGGKMSSILDMAAVGSSAGVFTLDRTGSGQVAAVNQDGSINGVSNPVPRGQIISLYATGLGQTTPAQTDGEDRTAGGTVPASSGKYPGVGRRDRLADSVRRSCAGRGRRAVTDQCGGTAERDAGSGSADHYFLRAVHSESDDSR